MRKTLQTIVVMGGVPTINATAPAITPTLSSELVINGDFAAWTGDDPDSWTIFGTEDAGSYITEATAKCQVVSDGDLIGIRQDISMAQWAWYQVAIDVDTVTGGGITVKENTGFEFFSNLNSTGSKLTTNRAITTNGFIVIQRNGACDVICDNLSVKAPTFSTCRSLMGSIGSKTGTYTSHPTVTSGTFAGMLIEYLDDNNFVYIVINGTNAYMISRISSTDTIVKSGAIVYSVGAELKAVVDGTTHQLFYNNIQVSTDGTIDNSGLGTQVQAFNTYATNTVGVVTANP